MELDEAMAKEKKSYQKEKTGFADSLVCAALSCYRLNGTNL